MKANFWFQMIFTSLIPALYTFQTGCQLVYMEAFGSSIFKGSF